MISVSRMSRIIRIMVRTGIIDPPRRSTQPNDRVSPGAYSDCPAAGMPIQRYYQFCARGNARRVHGERCFVAHVVAEGRAHSMYAGFDPHVPQQTDHGLVGLKGHWATKRAFADVVIVVGPPHARWTTLVGAD